MKVPFFLTTGSLARKGLTLVELLIVMAIVVMFAALVAAFYPSASSSNQISKYATTIQSALLSARNRAKTDRLPTGLRFYTGPLTAATLNLNDNNPALQVVTIQKPPDVLGRNFAPITKERVNFPVVSPPGVSPFLIGPLDSIIRLQPAAGINAYSMEAGSNIVNGDMIRLDNGSTCLLRGPASLIFNVPAPGFPNSTFAPSTYVIDGTTHGPGVPNRQPDLFDISTVSRFSSAVAASEYFDVSSQISEQGFWQSLDYNAATTSYTLVRAARELSGEAPFELSESINIVLNSSSLVSVVLNPPPGASPPTFVSPYSRLGVMQSNPFSTNFYFDILFNPSGSVETTTSGDIMLWLHQIDSEFGNYSKDAILVVRKNNGSIGVYEVAPGADPFAVAKDPRNKGI